MHFESEFILNRQHLEECYDQSLTLKTQPKPRYKLIALLFIAAILIFAFVKQQNFLAFFLVGLAMVEAISFRYRRAWWLTRQVWSRNSGNTIKLVIDDHGITTQSVYINNQLLWADIINLEETSKGLIITLKNGATNYLSKENLNTQVIDFMKEQVKNH